MDYIATQVNNILTYSICGVSIATIIAMIIYVAKTLRKVFKQLKLNKEDVENAFNNAVLPKNVKLDVSSKIEAPIKEGLRQISDTVNERMNQIEENQRLTLSILSQFSHVEKLPKEEQEKIKDIVNKEPTTTIPL